MREIYGATLALVEPYQTVLTAIKPYELAERQAVLTVKYNTNITPAEEERRSECFTHYSRVLTPTAFIQSFNGRAQSRILKQNSLQKKKTPLLFCECTRVNLSYTKSLALGQQGFITY